MKTNNLKLLPYSSASKGAKRLAEALDIECLNRNVDGIDITKLYLNWGNSPSNLPSGFPPTTSWINNPIDVDKSVDKMRTFPLLREHNVPTLDWFTSREAVDKFLAESPWIETVVSRHNPRGMRGKEMSYTVVDDDVKNYPSAPLYTMLYDHEAEVRVHVVFGEIVEIHDKTAHGFKGKESGYDYTIDKEMLSSVAIAAVAALNLDIAAVDLLWNDVDKECVVLEVNTAPEMKDGTLEAYVRAFEQHFNTIIPEEETPMKTSKTSAKTSTVEAKTSELSAQERVDAALAASKPAEDLIAGKASEKTSPKVSVSPVAKTSAKTSGIVAGKTSEDVEGAGGARRDAQISPEEMANLDIDLSAADQDTPCDCDDSFPMIGAIGSDGGAYDEVETHVLDREDAIDLAITVLGAEMEVRLSQVSALQDAIMILRGE